MDTESNRYSHIAFDRDKQEYRDSSKFNINIRANSTIAAIVLVIMKLFTVVNGLVRKEQWITIFKIFRWIE